MAKIDSVSVGASPPTGPEVVGSAMARGDFFFGGILPVQDGGNS